MMMLIIGIHKYLIFSLSFTYIFKFIIDGWVLHGYEKTKMRLTGLI